MKNEWKKWKNHFYEMTGDMSRHEKERNKKMQKVIHNPIPTSLFLSRSQHTLCRNLEFDVFVLFLLPNHSKHFAA